MSLRARKAVQGQTPAANDHSENRGCSAASTAFSWEAPCNRYRRALHERV